MKTFSIQNYGYKDTRSMALNGESKHDEFTYIGKG